MYFFLPHSWTPVARSVTTWYYLIGHLDFSLSLPLLRPLSLCPSIFFLSVHQIYQFLLLHLQVHWSFCHLHSAVKPSQWIFHFRNSNFQFWNSHLTLTVFISLLRFPICSLITTIIFFEFLDIVSIIDALHFSPVNSNIWVLSVWVSVDFFLLGMGNIFLFLLRPRNFLFYNGHCKLYVKVTRFCLFVFSLESVDLCCIGQLNYWLMTLNLCRLVFVLS